MRMAYHKDLLDQARLLAHKEPRKPKRASLRRAVSTTYYALFHLLVDESSRMLIKGAGPESERLRGQGRRAFAHHEMKTVSKQFSSGNFRAGLMGMLSNPVSRDLKTVAKAFVDLQDARHDADYDLQQQVTRRDVENLLLRTEEAFAAWARVRKTPEAQVYLTALLLGGRWKR